MKIQRREFLKRSALGVGGMLAASRLGAMVLTPQARSAGSKFFDPYERVTLGNSGLKVSRLCMGTGTNGWSHHSNQTRLGEDKFQRLLRDAYERGISTFDMADQYGTNPYLPRALEGVPRDKYQIITKFHWEDNSPNDPSAEVIVPQMLKELGTDHIDLLLIHCVTSGTWNKELRKQMDILSTFKEKGAIRALGVSCHSIAALEAAAADPWVESVHTRINPYGMSMDGSPEQVLPVIKKIYAAGKGVVGMKIIGAGKLSHDEERRQESVKFALHSECVHILNVGFESLDQIDGLDAHIRKTPIIAA
jgi:aryl-alcohol dehydrogenase-like predicted oxidoreductase